MRKTWRRALSLLLMLCILTGMLPVTALAAPSGAPDSAPETLAEEEEPSYQDQVEEFIRRYGDQLSDAQKDKLRSGEVKLEDLMEEENPRVSVIIELEGQSMLEEDPTSLEFIREAAESGISLMSTDDEQQAAARSIAAETGVDMDVKYTYSLAFNGIAAEVNYLDMDAIAQADGVASVYIDPVYEVVPTDAQEVSPNMTGSNETTGVNAVNGQYKGEGTVIAVIDTGLDLDHEAFRNAGDLVTNENTKLSMAKLAGLMQTLTINGKTGSDANSVYKSLKVPFAFNYADDGSLPADHSGDTQGDHGTHVAGIAAGYMVDSEGKVTFSGVAPAAQLIIMKVFGANRAGQWSDILAAMQDAALLGADIINLSLGSPAGFSSSSSAAEENTAKVLDTLTKAGVVVCASAGNEYTSAYGNRYGGMSLASNPDNGIVGSPASYDESLAVASVANTTYSGQFLWVDGRKIAFTNNASADSRNILKLIPDGQEEVDKEFAILTDGSTMLTGTADEFDQYAASSGIEGKFVVVRRGQTFTETAQLAEDAGAIGLIVADHSEGSLSSMAENTDVSIPAVFISKDDGDFLAGKKTGTITISKKVSTEANVGAGQMSDFSSWGVTSDLKLKPEITTPGGNIYSTRNNGTYGNMSGTSMASPNMAGLVALAKQYINKNPEKFVDYINGEDGNVDGSKLGDLITNLMMSTASPITDPDNMTYYSPRKQGAGLANIADAVQAEAFLSVEGAPSAKLDLGDDEGKTGKYTMTFTVNSLSSGTETYTLDTTALTEKILKNQQVDYQTYHWDETQQKYTTKTVTKDFMANQAYELTGVTVAYTGDNVSGSTVTVPANSSTTVTVALTLGDEAKNYLNQYPNGIYVDGFVELAEADGDGGSDLSIPFLAFYGDWEQAPILDEGTWMDVLEDNPIYPSFGFTTALRDSESIFSLLLETATPLGTPNMTSANQRELAEVGYDYRPSRNLYNPTPDSGYDLLFCDISLLRSAKDVTMTLYGVTSGTTQDDLDNYENLKYYVDTDTVYNTVSGENYNKTYHDGTTVRDHSDYLSYRFYWNGTDTSGSILPNGTLVIAKVTATMGTGDDESGNRRSSFYFPVVIHTVPPKVTEMNFTSDPDGITVQIDDPNFVGSVMMGIYGLKSKDGEVDYFTSGELTGVGEDALPEQFTAGGGTVTFDFPYLWDKAYNIWTVYAELTDLSGGYSTYYYHLVSWFDVEMDQTVLNEGRSLTLDYSAGSTRAYSHWEENTTIPGGHSYNITSSDPDLLSVTDNGDGTVTLTASADAGLTQAQKVEVIFQGGVNRNFEERYTVTVLPYLLQKQIDEAQPGDTVYWTGDDLTDSVTIDKDLTLDLGGATLTSADGEPAIRVRSGNVTITNGTVRSSSGGLATDGTQLLSTLNGEHPAAIRAEGGSVTLDGVTAQGAALTGQALVTHVSSAVDLAGSAALTIRGSELYGEYAVNNKVTGLTVGGAITVEDGYLSGDVASVKSYTNADTVTDLGANSVALDSDALYTEALSGGTAVNDLDFTGSYTEQSCTPYLYFDLTDPNEVSKWTATDATIEYTDGKMKVTANTSSAYIYRKLDQPVTLSGSQTWKIFFTSQSSSSLWNYVNVSYDGGASWSGNSGYLSGSNDRCNSASFSGQITDIRVKFDYSGHWILMNGFGAFASEDDAMNYTSINVDTSTRALTVLDQSALAQSAGLTTVEMDGQLTVTVPEPVSAGTDGAFSYRWVPVSVTLTPEAGEAQTAQFADGTAVLTPPEGAYTLSVNWSAEVSPSALRQAELDRVQDPDYESKAAADLKSYLSILSGQLDLSADVEALRTLKANLSGSMVEGAFKLRDERKIDTPLTQAHLNEYYAAYAEEVAAFSGDENGVIYQGVKGDSESVGVYWAKASTLTNPESGATVAKNGFYSTINSDGSMSGFYVDENYSHLSAALAQAEAAQPLFQELQSLCASDAGLAELQAWWGANGGQLLETALAVQKVIKDDGRTGNVNFASTAAWDSTYGVYYDRQAKVANSSDNELWEYLDGDGVTSTDGKAVDAAMTVLRDEGIALYEFVQTAGSFYGVTGTQRNANLLQQGKTQANGRSYAANLLDGIAANAGTVYALHAGEDGKQYLSAQGSGSVTYAAVALTSGHGQPAAQTLYYPAGTQITLPTLTEVGWTHTGWKDGETTYNLTDPYTVPEGGASLTALWEAGSVSYTLELYGADLTGDTYSSLGTVTVPAYTGQDIQLVQEGTLVLPEAEGMPQLSGYLFSIENQDNVLTATVAGDGSTVLKVYFDRAQFTLTAGEKTAEVTYGAPLTETLSTFTPVKEGHTFDGWYLDESLETPVSESNTMPAAPLTVYPKWTVNAYTITFDSQNGSHVPSITADYGSKVTAPEKPTREGFTFTGWFTDEDCQNVYTFTTMPAENLTLYAGWKVGEYTLEFNSNGGSDAATIVADYGTLITLPTVTRTGYTFGGWYRNNTFTGDPVEFTTMPAENLTLYAKWTVNRYTITFESGEGTPVDAITADYGSNVSAPENPTRTGYTFGGWYAEKDCSGEPYAFTTMPLDGVKLYAKWRVNSVTLTFDTGADGPAVEPITQDYGTPVNLPAPEKTGYTFGGWYADADCSGQTVELTAMPAESATLHAKWTANSYTITFVTGEGSPVEPITQDYGTAVTAPGAPTRTGYTFGGWYTEEACENPYAFTTMPVGGMTLYAKWTINSVTITFHSNGGSEVEPISGRYGDPLTEPDYPTLKGHSFLGWFTNEDLSGEKYVFETMPAQNLELYAKWVLNQYRVSFDTDGGTELDDLMVDYGAKVPQPEAPVKSGYFFQGWSLDGQTYDFTAPMPDTNLVLTAVWLKDSALQDLIDQTESGGTVTWTGGNFTTSVTIDKPLTLDLGGAVITGLAGEPVITSMPGAGQTVTIQNGTLVGGSDQGQPAVMVDGGTTVLRNMLCRGDSMEDNGTVVYNGSGADVHNNGNLTVYDSVLAGIYGINNGARGSYLGGGQIQLHSAVLLGLANDLYSDGTLLVPNTSLTLPEQDFSAQLREGELPQAVEELGQLLTVRRERIVIPAFRSDDVSTSYTFRDGMLEVTVTAPQMEDLAFASRWIPVQLDNGSQTANFTQQADGTFTASLPVAGGVQNCTIHFQGQLSFSSREMEQIVNLPLAVASGSLIQIGQFADLEARMYERSQTAKNLMRDTYDQITAAATDPTNALLISLFGIGQTITNMQDAIVAMGGSYVTGSGDSGLIGQLEAYHSQFSAVSGEAKRLAFLCENYSGIRDVVGQIYTQAEKLYQNASDPLLYSLIISNGLVAGYDQKVEQLKDVLKQFDDMLVELDGNRLLVLGDWQADTTGTFTDKVMAAAQVQDGYLNIPDGSTLTDGSEDTTATLSLSAQVVSVTCNWNDGSGQTTVLQGLAGDSLPAPAEPTRTGYTFGGWYTDENCTGEPYAFTVVPEADLELYAKWTDNQYTITFVTGEGATTVAPITADYGTAIQVPAAPTREGYSFIGWYTEETCENLYNFATMPAENITLYAKWQVGQYTITFDSMGGSPVATIAADYGSAVNAPADPTRTGFTFGGWYTEESCMGEPYAFTTMPSQSLTLYARWTVNEYTITFVTGEGATTVAPITADYGTAIQAPAVPTLEGYSFTGWYAEPDYSGESYAFTTMPAEDLTLYAKWQAGQYSITFVTSEGATTVAPIVGDYGTPVTAPADPTRTGYTFAGWDQEIPATMPATNLTITAQWTANQYTITFETGEGTAVAPITQDYGTTVTKPDDPTREGYSFTGWYTTPDYSGEPYAFTTMPAEDLTLYPKWQAGQYTITFDSMGGSAVETIAADYGSTVTAPAAPTRTGYTFGGWYTEESCENLYAFTTMPAQSITLYAKWMYVGGGSSSSGSSGATTGTVTNPDGSTTTTVTGEDGSKTETTKAENGAISVVTTDKDGKVEAEVKLPAAAVSEAAEAGEAVALPMPAITVTDDSQNTATVTVDLPANTTAKVEIPVADVTAGTVAVLVKADGTEEVIKTTLTTENGVAVTLADGDTVKIVDNSKDFSDVSATHWGADAVAFVTSRQLFNGTGETTFSPEGNMNRAMVVTVLARYDDVDTTTGNTWYEAGAAWAVENGVSDGTNLGGSITREQLVTMLWRYAGSPEVKGSLSAYPDFASVSDWALDAMIWAVDASIITGNGVGELNPQGTATRVEVATMLARFVVKTN